MASPDSSFTDSSSSLSHLSSQLQSHGYTTRPLDLSLPSQRSKDALIKCLWTMLAARTDANESLEKVGTELRVLRYDHERVQGMLRREKEGKVGVEKEMEGERAKARAAMRELREEKERHARTKEDLGKARSALAFVKTQAAHDLKRREIELSSALARLQRLSSDPAQTKFLVLNPVHRSTPSPVRDGSDGGLALLEEGLAESHAARLWAEGENRGLRELVGEVEEWAEGVRELRGLGGSDEELGDESFGVPHPSLIQPVPELASTLHAKLYHIRLSVQSVLENTNSRILAARAEVEAALEKERIGRAQEKLARVETERELETAKEVAAQTEQLVHAFTSERFLQGVLVAGQAANNDDTTDLAASATEAATTSRLAEVEKRTALDAQIQLGKERAQIAAQRLAEMEAKRARTMQEFLSGLDLDSPAPAPRPSSSSSTTKPSTIPTASKPSTLPSKPSTIPTASRSKPTLLSPLSERSELPSVDELPSPFLQRGKQRSALEEIMAMADSPPPSRETKEGGKEGGKENVRRKVSVQRTFEVKGTEGEKVLPATGMGKEVERLFKGEKVGSKGVGVVRRAGIGESSVF